MVFTLCIIGYIRWYILNIMKISGVKKNILDILDIRKIGLVEIDKDILVFLLRFSKKNNIINIYIQILFGSFSL